MSRKFYIIQASTPEDGVVIPAVEDDEMENIKSYMFNEGIPLIERFRNDELPLSLYYSPNFRQGQILYDFVQTQSYILIISSKVKKVFDKIGIVNVEYLPTRLINQNDEITSNDYCIANVLGGENIIDLDASSVRWGHVTKDQIFNVNKLIVDYTNVRSEIRLFRASKMLRTYFVDQEVVDALKEAGISGYGLWEADGWNGLNI